MENKFNTLLFGFGEIGKALYDVFKNSHNIDILSLDYKNLSRDLLDNKILLIAIPYSERFFSIVEKIQKDVQPEATIIFSTVAIGTCARLNAVHSPIEGRHPNLAESIRVMRRWVGGENKIANQFFWNAGIKTKNVPEASYTEFLKLRSTSLYGVNLEFARYSKKVADKLDMNFELVREFDTDYNKLYKKLDLPQFQRYILDAPVNKIGGHCVVPNALILDKQFPSVFLKEIYLNK
jgi:hypothetical protein